MQFDLFIILSIEKLVDFFISYRESESHMSDINICRIAFSKLVSWDCTSTLIYLFFYFHTPCTQTPDGANAVAIGELGEIPGPMVIMGGNCSLQGYDLEGNENFWTVAIFILRFKRSLLIIGDIYTNYAVS